MLNIDMNYLEHVNVKMGTNSVFDYSNGNTLPLTAYPFGMNHFTPETRTSHLIFNSNDHRINGIRLTHSFSPWLGDYNFLRFRMSDLPSEQRYSNEQLPFSLSNQHEE